MPMASDHSLSHPDDGAVHAHVSKAQFYWGIFGALVVLTIVTVKVSYYDFGPLNIVVALLIATMKASLVAVFFMHLRHDSLFNTLAFLSAFLFLGLFILLTYDDLGRRGQIDNDYGGTIQPQTGLAAPGGLPASSATANEASGEGAPGEHGGAEKSK
jgi:cytochrome c oxidase subunit 4